MNGFLKCGLGFLIIFLTVSAVAVSCSDEQQKESDCADFTQKMDDCFGSELDVSSEELQAGCEEDEGEDDLLDCYLECDPGDDCAAYGNCITDCYFEIGSDSDADGDDDDDNNDDNNDNNSGNELLCEPGSTQSCVCLGGGQGTQSCNSEGSGWEICTCNDGDDDDDDTDTSTDTDTEEDIVYVVKVGSASITGGSWDILGGNPDPYVCIVSDNVEACTKYLDNTLVPVWNYTIGQGNLTQLTTPSWTVSVYDFDDISDSELIGTCTFSMTAEVIQYGTGILDICGQYVEDLVFNFEPLP